MTTTGYFGLLALVDMSDVICTQVIELAKAYAM